MIILAGINEKNRKFLDALIHIGTPMFSVEDASKATDVTARNARITLGYLTRRGWLTRVKPGLYMPVPLGTINPREYRENPWVVANRIFSPCYIGGWSAAEHWGFTEQIFSSVVIFTSRIFRKKNIDIQGTHFVLKLVRAKNLGHSKGKWIGNVKVQVSDPIQTVVDVLDDPSIGGGIRHTADIVENYFNSEYRNDSNLIAYIKENKNHAVYKRLGYILDFLKIAAPELLEICKENISAGYSALDPTVKVHGTFTRKWNLRINAGIEK